MSEQADRLVEALLEAGKARVKEIEITRAEGRIDEPKYPVGKTFKARSFQDANKILLGSSQTIDRTRGIDKVDVKVTWTDGESYSFTWEAQPKDRPDLSKRVREGLPVFVKFGKKTQDEIDQFQAEREW